MSKTKMKMLISILIIISGSVGFIRHFSLDDGYSIIWLLIMFLVGFYIRKFDFLAKIRSQSLVLIMFGCIFVSLCIELLLKKMHINLSIMQSYTSPVLIIQSFVFFTALLRTHVSNVKVQRMLRKIAPATLGVYIIDQYLLFNSGMKGAFSFLVGKPVWELLSTVILVSIAMFIVFCWMDLVRIYLFRKFSIDDRAIEITRSMFNKISTFFDNINGNC